MPIAGYFALTAAEYQAAPPVSPVAWMACHFSPYGTGLSNLPDVLPPGSLLMLNDRTPIQGHDPERIATQLEAFWERQPCRGLVLDFQRPGCSESQALAAFLCRSCSVSVAVSSLYAQELGCPVFLPPVPLDVPAETWLAPWHGREIWLDLALEAQKLTLTATGLTTSPAVPLPAGFREDALHCHYAISPGEQQVDFTLWRTREDANSLLAAVEPLGVTTWVGLYQEFFGSSSDG